MCLSTSAPGGLLGLRLKWFLSEPFCQVKHSKKPMTRKPQHSLALLGPRTPHVLPKLAWKAGVIRGDDGGGNWSWGGLRLCLFMEGDVLLKLRWRFFIALLEGNVWVITLYIPAVGPSTRASGFECGCLYAHLKSLCWSCVYFQVYRLTFVCLGPLRWNVYVWKIPVFVTIGFLQRKLSSSLLLATPDCFFCCRN